MIKGFFMASGLISLYILYGKNAPSRKDQFMLYSLLNMIWPFALLGSIVGTWDALSQIICIVFTIGYPTALILFGIKYRKEQKNFEQKAVEKGLSVDNFIEAEIPSSCLEITELYRGRPEELEVFLKDCVKTGKITREQSLFLYQKYSNK